MAHSIFSAILTIALLSVASSRFARGTLLVAPYLLRKAAGLRHRVSGGGTS